MNTTYGEARAHYEKALQLGKKEGGSPKVLEEILPHTGIRTANGISLGIQSIWLEQIAGTMTGARKTSFSKSFYPLLKADTEFGNKWIALCHAHLEEGIHDPVKVYEYLNEFYVLEGNKRVSVLHYFDSLTVPAEVIRLVPPQIDRPDILLYYEFLDFYNLSRVNYIYFKKKGDFIRLQRLVGKRPDQIWSDDDRMHFSSLYGRFREEFIRLLGKQNYKDISTAFLTFISLYDYGHLISLSMKELLPLMEKCRQEFALQLSSDSTRLQMDPFEKKSGPIRQLITGGPKHLKAAFIHNQSPEDSSWTFNHDVSRKYLEKRFPDQVSTRAYVNADLDNIEEVLESAVADGHQVIFTTSPIFLKATLKAAVDHEDIRFLNCTTHSSFRHVRTYYARMYEAKFLMGAIAGAMSENGQIGYVADYPIYGTISNINAFALGAKMVNPRAKIHLRWSRLRTAGPDQPRTMEEIYRDFRERNIRVICDKDSFNAREFTRRIGLYYEEEKGFWNMAMPVWDWKVFYEKTLENILNGNWKKEENTGKGRGISYWWGLSSGIVDVIRSGRLPLGTGRLVDMIKNVMMEGNFNPFSGLLYGQEGIVQDERNRTLSPEEILTMDWLAENVIGSIPKRDDLTDSARDLYDFLGVDQADHIL